MHRTFIVSYPRSGQHYCQRLLERVSGMDRYCELYNCRVDDCPGKRLSVADRIPCPAGMEIQKSHDFDLALPLLEGARYAVLIRRPLYSIVSYYEHSSRSGRGVNIDGEIHPHSHEAMQRFVTLKAEYWRDLVLKWLSLSDANELVRVFNYDTLISDRATMLSLCDFVLEDYPRDKAEDVVSRQLEAFNEGRVGKGKLEGFRYPADDILPILEDIIGHDLLKRAGLDGFL